MAYEERTVTTILKELGHDKAKRAVVAQAKSLSGVPIATLDALWACEPTYPVRFAVADLRNKVRRVRLPNDWWRRPKKLPFFEAHAELEELYAGELGMAALAVVFEWPGFSNFVTLHTYPREPTATPAFVTTLGRHPRRTYILEPLSSLLLLLPRLGIC